MVDKSDLGAVRKFWENHPLWTGESSYQLGTREFFQEHNDVTIGDCLCGELDPRTMPLQKNKEKVLDLGCGPGFWLIHLANSGVKSIFAADLTERAISIAKERCSVYGIIDRVKFKQENAENLSFSDAEFNHVNCQGVIHHTPQTEKCLAEIARVLKKEGTASISVYHRNIFLRCWPFFRIAGGVLSKFNFKMKGRGRESIFAQKSADEIVRIYDGIDNPLGKAYTKTEFKNMLAKYFKINEIYLHYFTSRSLPFRLPKSIHKFLDKYFGFMVYATVEKKF